MLLRMCKVPKIYSLMKKQTVSPRMTKDFLITIFSSLIIMHYSQTIFASEKKETSMPKQTSQLVSIENVTAAQWKTLAEKKIYFGHHSVGVNIIAGIKDLMEEYPGINLNIVKSSDESDFNKGIFAHSGVGTNGDPKSKIDDFINFLDRGIGHRADLAGFKFCYVDILLERDVDRMFEDYKVSISKLKSKYPNLSIIHFTIPLTLQRTTWKHVVKKTLHIDDPWRYGPNIKRNRYNEKLVEEYQGKDAIFDIAKIESSYPDGTRCTFEVNGKSYYALVPQYTSDGGHLNEVGRKTVAEQLIFFLASIK